MGDNEPGKWHPWCGTTALAAIVLFGIGVAIGAVIW